MGGVDHRRAAAADEDVLAHIGHTHNLVRNDLANRQNQVIGRIQQKFVHFHIDAGGHKALGNLGNKFAGNFANLHHIVTPVVHDHSVKGNLTKESLPLLLGHRHMGTQGRHNIHLASVLQ